ncbi:ABC transporter substrate-binding protein [Pueribacillus theae]|uniref:ABC transporter substrate-binding protein n=1 Tax=Pueribacillus theae TaxID=2171751 RepID=A0A2U1K408_9BACI|nr:ABC transporter substrate-binding protein [Pueribacillus theae]PWA12251.1 ABC transporter substrate-binding protein [Pueribacillus theae]
MMALIAGCGTQSDKESSQKEEPKETTATNENPFPVTFKDDAGREVTIESEPESIVSIQPSNTEILFALGLGDKIIGVSDFCNYPAETKDIEKVGGQDIDAEKVLTLLPDVAFVTDYHYNNHPDILEQFEEAGIKVVVTGSASSFDDAYSTIEMLANATGTPDEAEKVITGMKERLEAIKEKAKSIKDKKRVWVEVSPAPDIFTTGKNTFLNEMLESIQAINVAADQEGWVKMNEEEIVKLNPDVIITTYGYYVDEPEQEVYKREGWAEVPAVKNKQVFDVDNDTVTRPGPRLIEGVERLAELIYPETFKK